MKCMFKNLFQKLVGKDWKKSLENDADLLKLQTDLVNLAKLTEIPLSNKTKLKNDLISLIETGQTELPTSYCLLADQIELKSSNVVLGGSKKYSMLADIKNAIGAGDLEPKWGVFRNWRSSLASLMIVIMFLGTLVILPTDGNIIYAAKITFLEEVKGEVYVNRDGNVSAVNSNFAIEEGDLIFTGSGSFVTIRYLDDSVTRLGENTSLQIKKLYVRPDNQVETKVEVSLVNGQIWAGVYNLVDQDSRFVVDTPNARAMVNNKASFELKADPDTTTIAVFDNVVDVTSKAVGDQKIQPVVSGFKARVESHTFLAYENGVSVEKNIQPNDGWTIMNMELDDQHQQKLKDEGQKIISDKLAGEESLLSFLTDFKDTTKSIFNNSEIEKARHKYVEASFGFIKAQQILKDSGKIGAVNVREARPLLLKFRTTVSDLMNDQKRLVDLNPDESVKLFDDIKSDMAFHRKTLSLILPREELYAAKEILNEASGYLAENDVDKKEYILARSRSKLYEAQQLIAKNDLKAAQAVMDVYWKNIDSLTQFQTAELTEDGRNVLYQLMNEQIDQYKVLTALQSELEAKGDQKFSMMVAGFKKSSLDRLTTLVKTFEGQGLPQPVVSEIASMVQSYQEQSVQKNEILAELSQIEVNDQNLNQAENLIIDNVSSPELESAEK